MRTRGVEQETIDFLQGRVPRTVFARHYFRPDFKNDGRIINALKFAKGNSNLKPQRCQLVAPLTQDSNIRPSC